MGIFVYQTNTTIKEPGLIDQNLDITVFNIISVIFRNTDNINNYSRIVSSYLSHQLLMTRELVGNILTTKRFYDSEIIANTVKASLDEIYADNTLYISEQGMLNFFDFNYSIYEITDEEFSLLKNANPT
jgi:hypothetical protein